MVEGQPNRDVVKELIIGEYGEWSAYLGDLASIFQKKFSDAPVFTFYDVKQQKSWYV